MEKDFEQTERQLLIEKLHPPFNTEACVAAFESLGNQLKDSLHEYDTIIGDDISGRLPTIVFAELAKRKREQLGLTPPQVLYINAGSNFSNDRLLPESSKQVAELIKSIAKPTKSLIVTEYIDTGDSISAFVKVLEQLGISTDVCSLSTKDKLYKYQEGVPTKLLIGSESSKTGEVFTFNYGLTGLKSTYGSITAEPRSRIDEQGVKIAKADMSLIADYLWKIIE